MGLVALVFAFSTAYADTKIVATKSDKRECILALAKNLLDTSSIRYHVFEPNVYYRKGLAETTEYTVYTTDRRTKVQFKAEMSNGACTFVGQFSVVDITGNTSYVIEQSNNYSGYRQIYPSEAWGSKKEEEEKTYKDSEYRTKVLNNFMKEFNYAPSKQPGEKIKLNLDQDLILKDAPVLIGEAALWRASNKITKFNTGKLKVVRMMGKAVLVAEESGHFINAYEVINDGGKPKYIALDSNILDQVKKIYKDAPGYNDTGVLVDPATLKHSLEAVPHKKVVEPSSHGNEEKPKVIIVDGLRGTPTPIDPVDEKAEEARKRKEAILKGLGKD